VDHERGRLGQATVDEQLRGHIRLGGESELNIRNDSGGASAAASVRFPRSRFRGQPTNNTPNLLGSIFPRLPSSCLV
jgi:hypothetical protein